MPTLLIVDDHASVLHTLEFVFAGADLRIRLAESGAAALALAEQDAIDAALVDLHMPAMDGLALTRALKAHGARSGQDVPIWLMSAAPGIGAAEQSRQAGAEELLKNPFDCVAFRATLLQRLNGGAAPATFAA